MLKLIKLTFLFIILLTAFESLGQNAKPKKSYEIRDLSKLIGIWESETTITIDTVPHKVTYRMNFRKTADGYGINMDEAYSDSALGDLRGANLIGFGYDDKKIHWYSVDNMGNTYERIGQWNDSEHLYFSSAIKRDQKNYNEVITYEFYGNDEFTFKHSFFIEGKEVKKVAGKFKRRQPGGMKPNK